MPPPPLGSRVVPGLVGLRPLVCRHRPSAAVSFQFFLGFALRRFYAASAPRRPCRSRSGVWRQRAPARALLVIKSHSLGLKKLTPTPLFHLLKLLADEKPDALDIQVLAGALGVFARYIAMADDVRRAQAGDMADEHRT